MSFKYEIGDVVQTSEYVKGLFAGQGYVVKGKQKVFPNYYYLTVEDNRGHLTRINQNKLLLLRENNPMVFDMIDTNSYLETSDKFPVQIVTTSGRDNLYPILAYVADDVEVISFSKTGTSKCGNVQLHNKALENESWFNVYKNNHGDIHLGTKHDCYEDCVDGAANAERLAVGRVKVVFAERQWDVANSKV